MKYTQGPRAGSNPVLTTKIKVMIVEVWEDECSITVFTEDDPNKDFLLIGKSKLLRKIEGNDWDDCMRQHHKLMGWEEYLPIK